jgi:acetyl/propionyl-CoA carboxylase alpha subunit
MKLYSFQFNGKKLEGHGQVIKDKLWIYLNGETFIVDHGDNQGKGSVRSRKKLDGRSTSDAVIAPMPGKITKILCQNKSAIILGQALVVMEAMKMEYTLKSEMTGEVLQINVKEGQQVALGDILIQLKEV